MAPRTKTQAVKVRRLAGAKMIAYLWQRACWFSITPLPDGDMVEVTVEAQHQAWLYSIVNRVEGKK